MFVVFATFDFAIVILQWDYSTESCWAGTHSDDQSIMMQEFRLTNASFEKVAQSDRTFKFSRVRNLTAA